MILIFIKIKYANSKLKFLCEIRETLDTKRTEAAVCKL